MEYINKINDNSRFYIRKTGQFISLIDSNTQLNFYNLVLNDKDNKTARDIINKLCSFTIEEYIHHLIHERNIKPNRNNRGEILDQGYEDNKKWQLGAWCYTTVQALNELKLPLDIIPLDLKDYSIEYERELLEQDRKKANKELKKLSKNNASINNDVNTNEGREEIKQANRTLRVPTKKSLKQHRDVKTKTRKLSKLKLNR